MGHVTGYKPFEILVGVQEMHRAILGEGNLWRTMNARSLVYGLNFDLSSDERRRKPISVHATYLGQTMLVASIYFLVSRSLWNSEINDSA